MLLLIDEDVPQGVADFFASRGHEVRLVRDEVLPRTPDEVIALLAHREGAIVVTCNARHFKRLISRVPHGARRTFRDAGRITLECSQVRAQARVEELIDSIEFEYQQGQQRRDRRLMFEIMESKFSVIR